MKRYLLTAIFALSLTATYSRDSLQLYFFLLDDCVICQAYGPTIKDLHETYGDQVAFVGYFPNFSSKPENIDEYKKKHDLSFPMHTDYYKKVCAGFSVTITPEVVLYNHTTKQKLYQGRIDNLYASLGKRRHHVTKHDLTKAIDAVLKEPTTPITSEPAVGCYINYNDAVSKYHIK